MKSFLLAALVAAGLACTASDADAQFRRRGVMSYSSYPSYSYGYPSYSYSTYSSPYSYAYPSYYDSGVVTSSYASPSYYDSGVITSGYTTGPTIYSGSSFYPSYSSYPSYSPSYYGGYPGYSGYPSYYAPTGITPSGVYLGGQRIWRW